MKITPAWRIEGTQMHLGSPEQPAAPRRSIRSITATPHLHGGFPASIRAGWCVQEGPHHLTIDAGQAEVLVGNYLRPVLWPEIAQQWPDGPVSAGRYFEIVTTPDLAHVLHNVVEPGDAEPTTLRPPIGLTATLYPYQMAGFAKMASVVSNDVGALLCDEMGLGKTIQAIALLLDQADRGQSIVIAPSSLLTNWEREFTAFAPGLSVLRHTGSARTGIASPLLGWDVILTTYDIAINDVSFLRDIPWNLMILDEAQRIKNPETARSQVIKSIPSRAKVCVTGTPVENSLTDLWSLSEASLPSLLGSLDRFKTIYPDDMASALALGEIVAPITVRRAVADVADDLPELVEAEIAIDMDAPLRILYDESMGTGTLADITNGRVIAAHGSEDPRMQLEGSAKGEVVLQMLHEVFSRNEKALVFASFSRTLDRLLRMAHELNPSAFVAVVDGRVSPDDRQKTIDSFSAFSGPGALCMNPQAAGEGLNITAANHVIHFNPEWNPAKTKQATARAYRRKQTSTVFAHHLYYVDSVEDDAIARAARKTALALSVADGLSGFTPGE